MKTINKILEYYKEHPLLDEDGQETYVELSQGLELDEIIKFEENHSIKLPDEFVELLKFSNGIDIFGFNIYNIDEVEVLDDLILISNWGNGDFNCLSLNGEYSSGTVLFFNHSSEKVYRVVDSLTKWIYDIINEFKTIGTILHPMDYSKTDYSGIYRNIYKLMKIEDE